MPKYWGKNYFAHGSFPEVGQKQKTEKKKKERKRERKLVITMAKLRMAHGSTHGARKPPGPIYRLYYSDVLMEAVSGYPAMLNEKNCPNYPYCYWNPYWIL